MDFVVQKLFKYVMVAMVLKTSVCSCIAQSRLTGVLLSQGFDGAKSEYAFSVVHTYTNWSMSIAFTNNTKNKVVEELWYDGETVFFLRKRLGQAALGPRRPKPGKPVINSILNIKGENWISGMEASWQLVTLWLAYGAGPYFKLNATNNIPWLFPRVILSGNQRQEWRVKNLEFLDAAQRGLFRLEVSSYNKQHEKFVEFELGRELLSYRATNVTNANGLVVPMEFTMTYGGLVDSYGRLIEKESTKIRGVVSVIKDTEPNSFARPAVTELTFVMNDARYADAKVKKPQYVLKPGETVPEKNDKRIEYYVKNRVKSDRSVTRVGDGNVVMAIRILLLVVCPAMFFWLLVKINKNRKNNEIK
mgnify:CR=1 FL=1